MQASDIAFITKILQMCFRKYGIAIFSFNFSVKRPKKSQKAKHKASQLEMKPKKAKRSTKIFRPTNLKRG